MSEKYTFPCGCAWPVIGPPPRPGALPLMDVDDEDFPFCPLTWQLLGRGLTKGVFQLESPLGRQWTKSLQPTNGEHIGALGAILRPGCIGGDTSVAVGRSPRSGRNLNFRKVPIRDLFAKFSRQHFHYRSNILSVNEKTRIVFDNRIVEVTYSGIKPVFRVIIRTGYRSKRRNNAFYDLECTPDHRLLTLRRGWVQLQHLRPGERIAVLNNRKPNGRSDRSLKLAPGEKHFRDTCWLHYEHKCVMCDWQGASLDVNHLVENRKKNNGYENLCFLCPNHHRMYSEGRLAADEVVRHRSIHAVPNTEHVIWLEYLGNEAVGEKDTYDIAVDGPNHNFLAGNFVVHNCLRAFDDEGLSMTDRYCQTKNNLLPLRPYHPVIDPILQPTMGCLVYQEQAMEIAKAVAGFSLMEADKLRKAIGKKLASEMAKVERLFVDGCAKAGILSESQAREVFGWIQKSQRYSFNKCISESECIRRPNGGRYASDTPYTVGEMYRIRHDLEYAKATGHEMLRRKWNRLGHYGKGLSRGADGRIRPNTIRDIRPAGIRPVYKVTLANGDYIRVTGNHKFPTNLGVKTVDEMADLMPMNGFFAPKLSLFVCGDYEPTDFSRYGYSSVTKEERQALSVGRCVNGAVGEHNFAFTNGSYTEFKKNDVIIPRICEDCDATDENARLELHHKDGDRCNSSFANLARLCSSCHKKREYASGRTKRGEKGYPSLQVEIVSVAPDGEEITYDVTMDGPDHNFVTGAGIVTCNSHAVAYGLTGYDTAYIKAHWPRAFYTSWLRYAKGDSDPREEIYELVTDGKLLDVEVLPPDIRTGKPHFSTDGERVRFGLTDIAGVGVAHVATTLAAVAEAEMVLGKPLGDFTWFEFLVQVSPKIQSNVMEGLVAAGAVDWFGVSRTRMQREYESWSTLTDREVVWVQNHARDFGDLTEALRGLSRPRYRRPKRKKDPEPTGPFGGCNDDKRETKVRSEAMMLENPGTGDQDTPRVVARLEEKALGISLTCSEIDSYDVSDVNTSCKDFLTGRADKHMVFGVRVKQVRPCVTKRGQNPGQAMARLTVEDHTGYLNDAVCFPDAWATFSHLLTEGNLVLLKGERDRKQQSLVVQKVCQLHM